jgi:eukaryotic-like serine/threonine-protein kinase
MTDEEIFAEAIQLSGSKRTTFLDSACGGECPQRERVERLIVAHESPDSYLENALPESGLADTIGLLAASKHPVIGNYKLLHKLGEGGFGVVYMAEQLKPVRRKVAIKILKADRLSDPSATVARFEAERQALAMMDHPNIATIFDGGTLPAGSSLLDQTLGAVERPFFVMELVKGVPT